MPAGHELERKVNVVNCEIGEPHRDNRDIVLHVIGRWPADVGLTFAPDSPQEFSGNLLCFAF